MGRYINRPDGAPRGKVEYLLELGAKEVDPLLAEESVEGAGVIVLVDNGLFEAAGYAYSPAEFAAFIRPDDPRPKRFFILPRDVAEREAK